MVQRGVSHCVRGRFGNFLLHFHTVFNRTVENFNPAFTENTARDARVALKLLRARVSMRLKTFGEAAKQKNLPPSDAAFSSSAVTSA
jgi:hypothetical protein